MLMPEIEGLIHVPGLRGNPERTYSKTSAVGPSFPGTFHDYAASVISNWQASDKAALEQLGAWLEALGLTWKVDARSVDDTRVELRVGRLLRSRRGGAHDMVNVADAGFGLSQVLPVLVALLAARPGQLVYLEQPEIHLHPRAQRRLAGVLAAAAQRGARLVVETHSALLLREIQTLVAKGHLAPDLVKLHWFKRNPEDGVTAMSTADLDQNGAFGDWPEDFDEVHLGAEKDYLDAVEEKVAAPS
jgi:predicted ATPase